MRISDWSSDVCSSDLTELVIGEQLRCRLLARDRDQRKQAFPVSFDSLRWPGAERFEFRARLGQALGHAVDRCVVDGTLQRPVAVVFLGSPPPRPFGVNGLRAVNPASPPPQAPPGR